MTIRDKNDEERTTKKQMQKKHLLREFFETKLVAGERWRKEGQGNKLTVQQNVYWTTRRQRSIDNGEYQAINRPQQVEREEWRAVIKDRQIESKDFRVEIREWHIQSKMHIDIGLEGHTWNAPALVLHGELGNECRSYDACDWMSRLQSSGIGGHPFVEEKRL